MFITNNHASFHLRLKENLVKHQKIQNILPMVVDLNLPLNGFLKTWNGGGSILKVKKPARGRIIHHA